MTETKTMKELDKELAKQNGRYYHPSELSINFDDIDVVKTNEFINEFAINAN